MQCVLCPIGQLEGVHAVFRPVCDGKTGIVCSRDDQTGTVHGDVTASHGGIVEDDFVRAAAVGDVVSSFIAAQIEGVRAAAALQGVGGLSLSAPECGSALRADDEVAACTAGKYDGTGG